MRAAVLGRPVGHSLSPALHNTAYHELGVDWTYQAIECDEQALPGLLDSLDASWAGLSLTMPLKRAVLPLLDECSGTAQSVGAANTVVLRGGRRVGHNTDVRGMVDALREAGVMRVGSAVVLGSGATACSALGALHHLGLTEVTAVVRDRARAGGLVAVARRFGVRVSLRPWAELAGSLAADLLVSTVPSGAADAAAEVVGAAPACRVVFDVVYEPWPTALATAARGAGARVVGGFPLLLHQAARQVELLTGVAPAPVEAMRAAGERALARRANAA